MNLKNKVKTYRHKDVIVHKFDKIMFLSCVKLSQNRYQLTYLIDYTFILNENKTLIPITVIIPFSTYVKVCKVKFGVWLRCGNRYPQYGYLYIYQNLNNNKFIFKTTRNDNFMKNGSVNQYNHELIFKASLESRILYEYMR